MADATHKGLYARVYGVVQGVGFRYSTVSRARRLGLSGYARNRSDGTVEVLAEGNVQNLAALLKWLHQGPSMARVTNVEHRYMSYSGNYKGFGVEF